MKQQLASLALVISILYACNAKSAEDTIVINNSIYSTAIKFSKSKLWIYDALYYKIPYPNGDVPSGGACTDVVIRVLRDNGIDLQKEVHESMLKNFALYPNKWGLKKPDANIDHRRVPNLMVYFNLKGYTVKDFKPGDIICWELSPGITHIGILLTDESVYHNIGPMAKIDKDFLFSYKIIGHYRIKQKI
jgi:uncharacterized protein YijF (DUF1287 family)